ncbi:MAG: hypothetical protein ACXQS2_03820 [Methermicoccaceae archaeon]
MPYTYGLDEIRDYITDEEDEHRPYSRLRKGILIHATTEDRLDSIRKRGLLPRGLAGCYVWSDEKVPMGVDVDEVLICRENNVFFWDDLCEGLAQAIATVGYLKSGNPGVVIVDVRGLEDELKFDPEVHRYGEPEGEDPIAYMLSQPIPPERVLCVCRLEDEHKPDMGKVACPIMHEKDECPNYDVESLYEEFVYDDSKWVCECRKPISEIVGGLV